MLSSLYSDNCQAISLDANCKSYSKSSKGLANDCSIKSQDGQRGFGDCKPELGAGKFFFEIQFGMTTGCFPIIPPGCKQPRKRLNTTKNTLTGDLLLAHIPLSDLHGTPKPLNPDPWSLERGKMQ